MARLHSGYYGVTHFYKVIGLRFVIVFTNRHLIVMNLITDFLSLKEPLHLSLAGEPPPGAPLVGCTKR